MKVPVKVYSKRNVRERFLWSLIVVFNFHHLDQYTSNWLRYQTCLVCTDQIEQTRKKRMIECSNMFALRQRRWARKAWDRDQMCLWILFKVVGDKSFSANHSTIQDSAWKVQDSAYKFHKNRGSNFDTKIDQVDWSSVDFSNSVGQSEQTAWVKMMSQS